VWSGLLGGRRIHGDVEIAEKAAKHKLLLVWFLCIRLIGYFC